MHAALRLTVAVLVFASSLSCRAGGTTPPVGSYGFDSLKPETTKCAKLDAAQVARLKDCTYSKNNNFGDDRPGWSCRIGKQDGFMVYATKADCQEELELEKANGD